MLLSLIALLIGGVLLFLFSKPLLTGIGKYLVRSDPAARAEAVVVLWTGVDYYPRLIEAARLYREGLAGKVVINGNRKTEVLRNLEKKGFKPAVPWHTDFVRILQLLGVPSGDIIPLSAEDVYDTVSEAQVVGTALIHRGFSKILITTSKFHTRRAGHIWERAFPDRLEISMVAAREDPYQPQGWWKKGRQIKWVLSEYGAWLYALLCPGKGLPLPSPDEPAR